MMKKPDYAKAMELRVADEALNAKFNALPDVRKWEWLAYACHCDPQAAMIYARQLVAEHG